MILQNAFLNINYNKTFSNKTWQNNNTFGADLGLINNNLYRSDRNITYFEKRGESVSIVVNKKNCYELCPRCCRSQTEFF